MAFPRSALCFLVLASAAAQTNSRVKAWEGALPMVTYDEGPPGVDPPFDLFSATKINYPYTIRNSLTGLKQSVNWRAVFLENEYLQCSVLPDLGGHLYTCIDKISGKSMFYANPAIKKAAIGYRGAWAAFGDEFNFPVSHNWVSLSPVDFGYHSNPDGSASVMVGNTDLVTGMRWNVEMVLRPGSTLLEQHVTLENPSDVRHRFFWWNNGGVEVWEDSKIEYPMRFTEGHGLSDIDTWPVDAHKADLSVIANQKFGPVSRFVHGSREPFMGVYHLHTQTGIAHYADFNQLPAKKIWSWGEDADGLSWRTALSDNNSAYVEVQGGLFRNQETYEFLEPGQTIRFEEDWMPVRGTGGISRANREGVVAIQRATQPGGRINLHAALNVNRRIEHATLRITDGTAKVFEETVDLEPEHTWSHEVKDLPADHKYSFSLVSAGKPLLAHTEGVYDWTPSDQIKTGPIAHPPAPPEAQWSVKEYLNSADEQERNGFLSGAWETYQKGSKRFPGNPELAKASGRVAVSLFRYEDAERDLSAAPADAETSYYLGLAHVALGKSEPARASFEVARKDPRYQVAANLQLAELSAREQAFPKALQYLKDLPSPGDDERVGEESVALTRASGAKEQSKRLAQEWVKRFPNNTFFRYELALAGREDDGLWMHLGADAARVLDLALLYHRLGMNADAMAVLRRTYPAVPPEQSEPGLAPPQEDPQVGYLLAYLVGALWDAPSRMRTLYVFPNRAEMLPVFRTAIDKNPKDASAHYLLGCLLFSRGWVEQAIEQWQEARKLNPKIPALHSSLARALFEVQHKSEEAAQIYEEGVKYDPENAGLYIGWNAVLKAQNKPPADRAAMIKRYPLDAAMPENLVRLLITTLREDGKNDEADAWVRTHFFSRAEGGAPPPEVQTGKVIAAVSKPAPKPEAPANPEKFGFTQREESAPAVATIRSVRAKQDAAPITDPADPFWKDIPAVASDNNQYGNMVSPRKTEFRSRWTEGYLYFLFVCPFEELYLRPNPQTSRDTVGLWDWDVAEVFLGNDFEHIKRYKEFEVSPQSEWVDLDINLEARSDDGWKWNSGFVVAARIDKDAKVWYGAMKIPYKSIDTRPPRPGLKLRANLYRIEGPEPARKFICWQPTHSPTFHMPVAFGRLELVE